MLHLGEEFIDLLDFPGSLGLAPILEEAVDLVDQEDGIVLARVSKRRRDQTFCLSDEGTE